MATSTFSTSRVHARVREQLARADRDVVQAFGFITEAFGIRCRRGRGVTFAGFMRRCEFPCPACGVVFVTPEKETGMVNRFL